MGTSVDIRRVPRAETDRLNSSSVTRSELPRPMGAVVAAEVGIRHVFAVGICQDGAREIHIAVHRADVVVEDVEDIEDLEDQLQIADLAQLEGLCERQVELAEARPVLVVSVDSVGTIPTGEVTVVVVAVAAIPPSPAPLVPATCLSWLASKTQCE